MTGCLFSDENYREQPPSHESSRERPLVNSWMEGGTDMTTTAIPNPMAAPTRRPANMPEKVYVDRHGHQMTETELVSRLADDADRFHHIRGGNWFIPAFQAGLVERGGAITDQNLVFWIESRYVACGNEGDLVDTALWAMGCFEQPTPEQVAEAYRIMWKATAVAETWFATERSAQLREARKALSAAVAAKVRGEW